MTIIKFYLNGTKYFELDSIDPIPIKKELPLPKTNQIYKFSIYSRGERGHYRHIDGDQYYIYKDYDGERYLYKYGKRLLLVNDLTLSEDPTIKIFMKSLNDHYIYNILINDNKYKYILSSSNLSRKELNDKLFHDYVVEVISIYREDCDRISYLEMGVRYIQKKNLFYRLRKLIYD